MAEQLSNVTRAVMAAISHNNVLYGIPLQREDTCKFEVAVVGGEIVDYAYLRDRTIGLIGGRVEPGETIQETLAHEICSELGEATGLSNDEIKARYLHDPSWLLPPQLVLNYVVMQSKQYDEQLENIPRGTFEIYLTVIMLSDEAFESLRSVLVPLTTTAIQTYRPALVGLIEAQALRVV